MRFTRFLRVGEMMLSHKTHILQEIHPRYTSKTFQRTICYETCLSFVSPIRYHRDCIGSRSSIEKTKTCNKKDKNETYSLTAVQKMRHCEVSFSVNVYALLNQSILPYMLVGIFSKSRGLCVCISRWRKEFCIEIGCLSPSLCMLIAISINVCKSSFFDSAKLDFNWHPLNTRTPPPEILLVSRPSFLAISFSK